MAGGKKRIEQGGLNLFLASHSDPATAAAWAEALSDERQRNARLENIARNWLSQDDAAARDWIAKSALPDDVKKRLLDRK